MIYVVSMREFTDGNRIYTFFETNTESFFSGNKGELAKLLTNRQININTASLLDNDTIKYWYNQIHCHQGNIHTGSEYILLCKINHDKYKLARYDGIVRYMSRKRLNELSKEHKIANCEVKNGKVRSIDTYKVQQEPQFEQDIAEKYNNYAAKSAMLGRKMSFYYIVEGRQVKLKTYSGESKDVIVPKFITTIMVKAFVNCKIETVVMDNGLEYIGYSAFAGCNISEVVIPETVKFIGKGAFSFNKKLLTVEGEYREDRVKIINERTIVLDPRESRVK